MKDVLEITRWDHAELMEDESRRAIIDRCRQQPHSIQGLCKAMDLNPGSAHHHIKRLVDAGLLHQVDSRQVRGIVEKVYEATARYFRVGQLTAEEQQARDRYLVRSNKKALAAILAGSDRPMLIQQRAQLSPEAHAHVLALLEELKTFIASANGSGEQWCQLNVAFGPIEESLRK